MSKTKRSVYLLVLMALLLAIPTTVLANKQRYKAYLTPVGGSNAAGTAVLATFPDSVRFMMQVRNLSEEPWGAHVHGPDGSIVATLCGTPEPSPQPTCPIQDGVLSVFGQIMVQGITNAQFMQYLHAGQLYINVHTSQGVVATGPILP